MVSGRYLDESQVTHHHPQLLLTLIHLSRVCLEVQKAQVRAFLDGMGLGWRLDFSLALDLSWGH